MSVLNSLLLNVFLALQILLFLVSIINFSIWFFSLYFRLEKKVYVKPAGQRLNPEPVSILIPIYKERRNSILTTTKGVAAQSYPQDKLEVVFIIEADDSLIWTELQPSLEYLRNMNVSHRVFKSKGNLKFKAGALNAALDSVNSPVIGVYDADDTIPRIQVEEAVMLIEEGYDAVAVRVYRFRKTILGALLNLDTYLWYNIFVPFYKVVGKSVPFSGEGLFVRKEVLDKIGGFPEVLTEDSYLSLILTEEGFKTALLDSEVEELAPKDLKNNIKQRLRWNRGYVQCLSKLIRAKIPIKEKLPLLLAYGAPLTCGFSVVMSLLYIFFDGPGLFVLTDLIAPWLRAFLSIFNSKFLLSTSMSYIVGFAFMYLVASLIVRKRLRQLTPYILLLPIYWIYLGFVALGTPFVSTKKWLKTERR